jgi:hypothetical protein
MKQLFSLRQTDVPHRLELTAALTGLVQTAALLPQLAACGGLRPLLFFFILRCECDTQLTRRALAEQPYRR